MKWTNSSGKHANYVGRRKKMIQIKVSNMDELQKLINQAQDQIDQLQETLRKIEQFKVQVS